MPTAKCKLVGLGGAYSARSWWSGRLDRLLRHWMRGLVLTRISGEDGIGFSTGRPRGHSSARSLSPGFAVPGKNHEMPQLPPSAAPPLDEQSRRVLNGLR
jgi:hypothetical protein